MRIDNPRAPAPDEPIRYGYAQHLVMLLLAVTDRDEVVPKEVDGVQIITPTGVVRKHVVADLVLKNWVDKDTERSTKDYSVAYLNAHGRKALFDAEAEVTAPEDAKTRREVAQIESAIYKMARARNRLHRLPPSIHSRGPRRKVAA